MSTATPVGDPPHTALRGWRPGQRQVDILTEPFTQLLYRSRAVIVGDGWDSIPLHHKACASCSCHTVHQRRVRIIWIT